MLSGIHYREHWLRGSLISLAGTSRRKSTQLGLDFNKQEKAEKDRELPSLPGRANQLPLGTRAYEAPIQSSNMI